MRVREELFVDSSSRKNISAYAKANEGVEEM